MMGFVRLTFRKHLVFTIIIVVIISGLYVYSRNYEMVRFKNGNIKLKNTTLGDMKELGFSVTDERFYNNVMQQKMRPYSYFAPTKMDTVVAFDENNNVAVDEDGTIIVEEKVVNIPDVPFEMGGVRFEVYISNINSARLGEQCEVYRVIVHMKDNPEPFILYGKRYEPNMNKGDVHTLLSDYQITESSTSHVVKFKKYNHTMSITFDANDTLVNLSIGTSPVAENKDPLLSETGT